MTLPVAPKAKDKDRCPDCGSALILMFTPSAIRCTNWPACKWIKIKENAVLRYVP